MHYGPRNPRLRAARRQDEAGTFRVTCAPRSPRGGEAMRMTFEFPCKPCED